MAAERTGSSGAAPPGAASPRDRSGVPDSRRDVTQELAIHREFVSRLREQFPDADEQTLADTAEGETNLDAAIAAVLREAFAIEHMAEKGLERLILDMLARKEAMRMRAKRMKDFALWATQEAGLKKILAPDFSASVVTPKRGKVTITDESALAVEYLNRKVSVTPDKKAINAAIERGEIVAGVEVSNPQPHWMMIRK